MNLLTERWHLSTVDSWSLSSRCWYTHLAFLCCANSSISLISTAYCTRHQPIRKVSWSFFWWTHTCRTFLSSKLISLITSNLTRLWAISAILCILWSKWMLTQSLIIYLHPTWVIVLFGLVTSIFYSHLFLSLFIIFRLYLFHQTWPLCNRFLLGTACASRDCWFLSSITDCIHFVLFLLLNLNIIFGPLILYQFLKHMTFLQLRIVCLIIRRSRLVLFMIDEILIIADIYIFFVIWNFSILNHCALCVVWSLYILTLWLVILIYLCILKVMLL